MPSVAVVPLLIVTCLFSLINARVTNFAHDGYGVSSNQIVKRINIPQWRQTGLTSICLLFELTVCDLNFML